jgi:hypothetical protein
MKIVCPSRKRAKIFKTNITDMVVLVDKQEEQEYKDALDFEVITHDSLPSLSEIRQYAYELFGDVFFVDDDIVSVERLYTTESQQLNPDQVRDLIYRTQSQAEEIGAFLYGFNNDPVPAHYNEFKPFMMNGYINGCAMGINKGGHLYFDKRTVACESHWINCLNAYYNRFCFIDKRFHFRQLADSTFTLQGGQTGRRTLETEKQDTLFLRKMFGNSIEVKKEQNKTKQLHEYQRVLNIRL